MTFVHSWNSWLVRSCPGNHEIQPLITRIITNLYVLRIGANQWKFVVPTSVQGDFMKLRTSIWRHIAALVLLALLTGLWFAAISANSIRGESNELQKETYIASKHSEVFHELSCEWAEKINLWNRICFGSYEDSVASGRRPCKVCLAHLQPPPRMIDKVLAIVKRYDKYIPFQAHEGKTN